jgi:hypothetical protein
MNNAKLLFVLLLPLVFSLEGNLLLGYDLANLLDSNYRGLERRQISNQCENTGFYCPTTPPSISIGTSVTFKGQAYFILTVATPQFVTFQFLAEKAGGTYLVLPIAVPGVSKNTPILRNQPVYVLPGQWAIEARPRYDELVTINIIPVPVTPAQLDGPLITPKSLLQVYSFDVPTTRDISITPGPAGVVKDGKFYAPEYKSSGVRLSFEKLIFREMNLSPELLLENTTHFKLVMNWSHSQSKLE